MVSLIHHGRVRSDREAPTVDQGGSTADREANWGGSGSLDGESGSLTGESGTVRALGRGGQRFGRIFHMYRKN